MLTDAEAKEQIIQITNELFSMGLLTATGGNISALAEEAGRSGSRRARCTRAV